MIITWTQWLFWFKDHGLRFAAGFASWRGQQMSSCRPTTGPLDGSSSAKMFSGLVSSAVAWRFR